MKKGKLLAFAAIAAAAGYKIIKETSIVDKIIYKKEYDSAYRYIKAHYPGCVFSNLHKTDTGFMCIITVSENKKIALNMTAVGDGVYVFSETDFE